MAQDGGKRSRRGRKRGSSSPKPSNIETNANSIKSTTSLGKRRSKTKIPSDTGSSRSSEVTIGQASEYGSQASPMRLTSTGEINKVALLGAAGGIGQPLSLLLMMHSEYIQHLALFDVVNVHGVGADLSHIDRHCNITTHLGMEELPAAVKGAKVIIITAGLAQKPGMSRDDLFGSNASIMYGLARVCCEHAPNAMLAIISNPVNSLVPLVNEVYQKFYKDTKCQGKNDTKKQDDQQCDPSRRIFGVTTLDVVRASTLAAKSPFYKKDSNGMFTDPSKINIPVIGGHAGKTILPILSQAAPKIDEKRLLCEKEHVSALISSIQEAGIHVLNAKKGNGSATLAMAYAACRFAVSLLRAIQGESHIIECAYVKQPELKLNGLEYFATPLLLGKEGWSKSLGYGKLLPHEQQALNDAVLELKTSVAKGEDFAKSQIVNDTKQ